MNKRPSFTDDVLGVRRDVQIEVDKNIDRLLQAAKGEVEEPTTLKTIEVQTGEPSKKPATERKREPRIASQRRGVRLPSETFDEALVNVTTRLARRTKELLAESALRQRLAKATPDTEQAIIDEALQQWFKRMGYRPSETSAQESRATEPTSSE